ncbi:hypothetical protein [Phascolarctobacterium sp.]|uniref:type II toxin-antitoxin system RelE/ParE family toxin n=1 Tax=Phascolarctobacterium sp. TaxID=2049039 RepID=UPI0015B301DC|nr:hypothetical protein [uncultured Phascolarctobacterium sp.]
MSEYSGRPALKLLPRAWYDLLEIGYGYSRQGSRMAAYTITCEIIRRLKELQGFSMLGKATPLRRLNEQKYLLLEVGKYDCIYRRIENTIYVYHIVDLRQAYPKLMK